MALVTSVDFADLTPDDRLLLAALRDRGLDAQPVVWDDASFDWSTVRVAVVRSTWDYWDRRDEFVAWAERAGAATALHNDADVIRWNTHKGYLIELEDRGVPVVPTAWLAHGDVVDLEALRTSRGWGDVVIKPAVSAGAFDTFLVRAGDADGPQRLHDLVAAGDALVQPYLHSVETGEVSLLFADGVFTHAVCKRPAPGDFRVQEEFEGTTERVHPGPDVIDLAAWILEATGHDFLYARVDLLPDDAGTWQLAELEVTEPGLFLAHDPGSVGVFADAIASRC